MFGRLHPSWATIALCGLVVAFGAAAPPAGAGSAWHTYSLYIDGAPVEGGTGTHVVRLTSMLLPDAFKVRTHTASLTFGPVGGCRSTGVIRPALVASGRTASAAVLADQLHGGSTYGEGTRGANASWRVAKFSGGALRAVSVSRTRLPGVWAVVRANTTPHGTCHAGGVRESLGFRLVDAFATIRANGY